MVRLIVPGIDGINLENAIVDLMPLTGTLKRPGEGNPSKLVLLTFLLAADQPNSSAVASEIAALLALAANRRIEALPEVPVRMEGQDTHYFLGYSTIADRLLHSPIPADTTNRFLQYLARIGSLPKPSLLALSAAVSLHYGSALLSQTDVRSAYLLAVAGLEVLSRQYGDPPLTWTDWPGAAQWDDLFTSTGLTQSQRDQLRDALLQDKQLRLKRTFCRYVATRLPNTFWDDTWEEATYTMQLPGGHIDPTPHVTTHYVRDFLPRDRERLARDLADSYDLRSGAVHAGKNLDLLETALRPRMETPPGPLPYATLRAILSSLITHELLNASQPGPLPDISFRRK